MSLTIPIKLILAFILGSAIGLEREIHEKNEVEPDAIHKKPLSQISFIGVRTISLVTALGTIAGLLLTNYLQIAILISIFFIVLLVVHYAASCWLTHDIGFTTELAVGYAYIIGLLIGTDAIPIQITIAISVVLMLILSLKESVKSLIEDVQKKELKAMIGYGLIALVILPFLPNQPVTLGFILDNLQLTEVLGIVNESSLNFEILNFFKLWMIVALITGIGLAGHFLKRVVGTNKGVLLSSLAGGFVSSTATIQSLAVQSKKKMNINALLAASMLANAASFVSFFLIMLPVNPIFAFKIFPTVLILLTSFTAATFYFYKKARSKQVATQIIADTDEKIFSINPALAFALIYMLINIFTRVGLILFGESGFLVATSIAGLTGIDAASLSIAGVANTTISFTTAVLAFVLVNTVNLFAKLFYASLQGDRSFTIPYAISTLIIVALSFIGIVFA